MPKLSTKAQQEILDWGLDSNADYCDALIRYMDKYDDRPPAKTTSTKNMMRALRMLKWRNTPDDWARLHATEAYLARR